MTTEEQELREIEAIGLAASEEAYEELCRKIREGMTADEWAAIKAGGRGSYGTPAPRVPVGVTGAEADIEANYPGGLAAFRRGERPDRTPYHKGEIEGY